MCLLKKLKKRLYKVYVINRNIIVFIKVACLKKNRILWVIRRKLKLRVVSVGKEWGVVVDLVISVFL